jgi:hypothetical protein
VIHPDRVDDLRRLATVNAFQLSEEELRRLATLALGIVIARQRTVDGQHADDLLAALAELAPTMTAELRRLLAVGELYVRERR